MRIQIVVSLYKTPSASEMAFWETLTVKSVAEAEAYCTHVEKNNAEVYLAFFIILGE